MWLVLLALRRSYSVAAFCIVIVLLGVLSVRSMLTDILPPIDIPVVIVVFNYPGLTASDMQNRVLLVAQRGYSTTVDGIEHMEAESILGIGIIKLYFTRDVDVNAAIAQITAQTQQQLRFMPPGITTPNILQFNASNIPVAQLTLSSAAQSELEVFDYTQNFLRLRLFTIPGLQVPPPYGGALRQVNIDIDPVKLATKHLSPQDVVNALLVSNVILPAGSARIGHRQIDVLLNSSPSDYADFNRIPIKQVNGAIVYLGDVALAHSGYAVQENVVRVNGRRATYLAILKKSTASTLVVVDSVKEMIPALKAAAPQGMEIRLDFDQSVFVRAAVWGVVREGATAALLVALMTLGFLGSWRSVLIVCTSIPLSILCGIIGLFLTGQTLNLMTLGGLSLAIGMLVDDATVEIENINRNRVHEPRLAVAVLNSARQVAMPALATTLTICIVFCPVVGLTGPARFLFVPLALSVVFAMVASYLLSRTLVPSMSHLLLGKEPPETGEWDPTKAHTRWQRFNAWRTRNFERLENGYASLLRTVLGMPVFVLVAFLLLCLASGALATLVGLDFFPTVDTGQLKLHFRAPIGSRIEDTERMVAELEREIRKVIPAEELETINDNIGVPIPINLAYVQSDNIGEQDADILIQLKPDHQPSALYRKRIREEVAPRFPGTVLYFLSGDVVTQALNFGSAAIIDVQLQGPKVEPLYAIARKMLDEIRLIPGIEDVRIPQVLEHPAIAVDVDRARAMQVGLSIQDAASSLLTSLTGTSLANPNFFVDPKNNVNYQVVVQTPVLAIRDVDGVAATPLNPKTAASTTNMTSNSGSYANVLSTAGIAPTLGSIATTRLTTNAARLDQYTTRPLVDVLATVEGRDLGNVARDVERVIAEARKVLPPGASITLRGQSQAMFHSFSVMGLGMVVAIALVYLLLVTLLQSWLDPFIIMVAIPGALMGVVWMLAATGTTINVESLMGSIMVIGIAVSNSNLLVNFANDLRVERNLGPQEAAVVAGQTRLRPVLMTALAMILGMLPMALALGEGGEQNAPLGRAVIGGLLVATFITLFVVPLVYSRLRKKEPSKHLHDVRLKQEMEPRS
ncbi:efflux RND transporter permease subunit [Myxococcus sp. K15C18031901]|uniref:efflux RND transporter permease subunit n=1 Tax=Myxococcus dinghuensis TaxID=2906761 RepID=UPI0020A803AC|nr:efflux RND transporter permease subunit [Myxococcus dinghuensis]MCP3097855.1 efflux RND transporter permease subunit [Myxococcus dinghuensis]